MQIKKIIATGLSAVMAGATLAGGALAAPLSDYPDLLGSNGQIDAFVVVGADAQPADIVGAGDVVAGLSSLSYVMVDSTGVSTTTGGEQEDLDIGTRLNETTAFTSTLEDSDIPSLADSEVTISIGGTSESYDYHEEIRLGTTDNSRISIETGLSSSNPDEDFKDDVFLEVFSDAVGYYYVFDEALKATPNITDATNDDPVVLDFMGRELIITSADTDSITVDAGERFFLEAGESAVTSDGKTVTLIKAVSTSKAQVSVNGQSDIIDENSVRSLGGTEVKVTDVADDEGIEFDSAVIIVGTDATFGEASDTFDNGEEYIIPCGTAWSTDDCDNDNPDWVWTLSGLETSSPTLGVTFNERIDSPDDNPPTVGSDNNVFDLPGGFAWISLDKLTTTKYQNYEMRDVVKDLKSDDGTAVVENGAEVLEFKGEGSDDSFTLTVSAVGKDSDALYFSLGTDLQLRLFWEDPDDGNKIKGFMNITTNGTTANAFQLNYEGASVPVDIESFLAGPELSHFNVTIPASSGTSQADVLRFYVQEDAANSGDISWLGHSDSDTTKANDVLYGTRDISGWEENTLTPDGIRVFDPDSNAPSDKYKIAVPSEFGTNDFQILITIGSSGTTVTTAEGGIKQLVPITTSVTKLDTEVGAAERAKNLVLVGGPAVNRLTAEAMGLPYPSFGSASGIPENAALVRIIDDAFTTGKSAVVAAGWTADDTRLATSVLQQAATKLAGETSDSVQISGSSVASAVITPYEAAEAEEAEEAMEEGAEETA